MKQQTAVEWLTEKLRIEFGFAFSNNILEQANEMFEQQVIDAFRNGDSFEGRATSKDAEQYYNQTFNKKK